MSPTSLPSNLVSPVEDDDLATLTSTLQPPHSEDKSTLNGLLVHAIRHNATTTIPYLVSLGASPLSDLAFDLLHTSAVFPAFECLVANAALDINLDLDWLGTFLILAVKRNDKLQVNFCLKNSANPNLGTYARRWSALATAAEYGVDLDIVSMLLAGGADLDTSDALQTAAEKGRVDLIQLLLDKGADIDKIGFEYCVSDSKADEAGTALHFAVDAGSIEVARLLLEKGADVGLQDVKGRTARERAEEKRMEDVGHFLDNFSIE